MIKIILNLYILTFLLHLSLQAQTTFVVNKLPQVTPAEDTIFITGSFNNWVVNDPEYMLSKRPNGHLAITLSLEADSAYEFKFTRGSWTKVETDKNNQYIANRNTLGVPGEVVLTIENWLDLGGVRSFPYLVFFYFAIAFQSLGVLLLIFRIRRKDLELTTWFYAINILFMITYLGVVFYYILGPIWQSYIALVGQTLLFCWGPFLYFLTSSLKTGVSGKLWGLHFSPFFMALVYVILRFLNLVPLEHAQLVTLAGLIIISFYLALIWLRQRSHSSKVSLNSPKKNFLKLFMSMNAGILVTVYSSGFCVYLEIDVDLLKNYDLTFISLSSLVMVETYYLWRYQGLLKTKKKINNTLAMEKIIAQLTYLMEEEKVYKSQTLNISNLSDQLDTKPHVLSGVLNTKFNKNFRDYVNAYRIEEFIKQAECGKLKVYTYLGLAHEVGFNSKSTFNLAFKKYTKQSPRDFIKKMAQSNV